MDSSHINALHMDAVPHPGETVLDYLDFHGWSQSDLARRAGLTPKTISEICNGKAPITPSTAIAFEKVFQRPAHLWLNLQRFYDEAEARKYEISKSSQWTDWARKFPLREMRHWQFALPSGRSDVDALLTFFGVSSPESWSSVWKASAVAYRQTRSIKASQQSIAAWVRQVEISAAELHVTHLFSHEGLVSSLPKLRKLTRERADESVGSVQEVCAKAGVAVVWVPELKNTGISGCVRWLTDRVAIIGLTLRHKTDDQLWFTFFHEIGHILLHRHKRDFIIDNAEEDLSDRVVDPEMQKFETEANRFSADTLIPPTALGDFLRKKTFTSDDIYDFAEMVGVSPGIVVGRLQHEGVLQMHQGNKLKQKLDWEFRGQGDEDARKNLHNA